MLVFGESILNDAVSIVLTNTAEGLGGGHVSDVNGWQTFLQALTCFPSSAVSLALFHIPPHVPSLSLFLIH
ncbi:hypothetical protein GDO78_018253, partial [Eleutherodactylus coqui]